MMGYTIQYSTRICDAILSSPVPSPEFFTVYASRLRFSVLPRATSLKMKLQCRSVGSLTEASERSPGFFINLTVGFTGSIMGIQWDIMGYIQIYIYNLCMRYHGWLPNSTPVEGCGKRKPWVSTWFNHPKVVQDFARIHSSFLKTVAQWLLEQQWLLYVILHCIDMQCFLGLLPLYPLVNVYITTENQHVHGNIHFFDWAIWPFSWH